MTDRSEPTGMTVPLSTSASVFSAAPDLVFPRLWFWLGICLVATVILLSILNPPTIGLRVAHSDKFGHVIAYAALMGWFAQIFRHRVARLTLGLMFIAMGVGLEFLQGMVPTRHYDLLDMAANTTGVLLAWLLASTFLGTVLVWFERVVLRRRLGPGKRTNSA